MHQTRMNIPQLFAMISALLIGFTTTLTSGVACAATNTFRPIGHPYAGNGYIEYLPTSYSRQTKSPLLIFFHGLNEDGDGTLRDLPKIQDWGPPALIIQRRWPEARPFVVLSPQHGPGGCPTAKEIHDFIQFAVATYNVDPKRVYLTGLSCGALGIDSYLETYGDQQIAAAVPIAGDSLGVWSMQGCRLARTVGLWVFHGDADNIVSIAGDNQALPRFQTCQPRRDVEYTVYPGKGHIASWVITYDLSAGHDIYSWLLKFSR